jgi:hypothetical protein
MPTGYTANVAEGQSFEDFVLGCARAFGACIMQRDDPMSDKPALQESSRYHRDRLIEAQVQLDEYLSMTEQEQLDYGQQAKEEAIYRAEESIAKNNALAAKYDDMLDQVRAWKLPSAGHIELKQFMINQLTESKDFDCNNCYNFEKLEEAKRNSPQHFYQKMLDSIAWNIKYHSENAVKEVERTEGRNRWITQLYESLDIPV